MTRDELILWLQRHGWKRDRWGHWQKIQQHRLVGGGLGERTYRIKITKVSIRYEVKSIHGWVRLRSAYLRDAGITAEDKLGGLTFAGCTPNAKASN